MIFYEEYARAGGPGRVGIIGEGLLGPTIVHFGNDAQKRQFLPGILGGTEIWCQGYSEPDAGSDLANVQTRAELDGDEWVINGQKVWTSLAHWAQWIFVIARTDRDAPKHKGLSYLLVPMDQPGRIEIRPIVQITGHSEFNETFFDGARTAADERRRRGERRLARRDGNARVRAGRVDARPAAVVRERAASRSPTSPRANGLAADPVFRQRLADAWITLRVMRFHALRTLPMLEHGTVDPATSIHKLLWASFHRGLGELAVDVLGADAVAFDDGRRPPDPTLPLLARRHDLRRLESDPTQRDRRAGPGIAEGAPMTNVPTPPTYPPGRNLLAGKTVLDHRGRRNRHRVRDREALPSRKARASW